MDSNETVMRQAAQTLREIAADLTAQARSSAEERARLPAGQHCASCDGHSCPDVR